MSMSNEQLTRDWSRVAWGGLAIVLVAIVAFVAFQWRMVTTPKPPPPIAQKLELAAPPVPPIAAAQQSVPSQPTAPSSAAPATGTAESMGAEVPRFDILRVDPDGNAVLAGRAAPDSEVTIYDGTNKLGSVTADKDGNWVLIPEQPLPPGQGQLTLSAKAKDGAVTRSEGTVAMLVPDRPGTSAPSSANDKSEAPIAVLVPQEGPATALQLPPLQGKGEQGLSMDIIEYGTKGDVILEGRAAPGAQVHAFLNNKKVGDAAAGQDGKWRIVTGEDVPTGRYKLKLESRNEAGKPTAQIVMPFERAALPEQLAHDLVIVQPGNSLWRIARRSYGRGIRYVEIYHANKTKITNPSRIFPGQLLQLPGKS
ncbi:MAG TPA: LysM peptidoglycan-binding domain-containing protein [Stellaceae bacterium]|nr:LysM peptidoglycan-binding domain-containing protein [Stellaceae bacterium]